MSGGAYGAEVFGDWRVQPKWRLSGSYSLLNMNIHRNPDSMDQTSTDPGGVSPQNQFYVRSSFDLMKNLEQDVTFRYVDGLPALGIPNYFSLDAHFGWSPVPAFQFSINGQNLLNDRHTEFMPDFISTTPTEVKRSFYGTLSWRF
jgi:iron complex outermembrane receptor protein